MVDGRALCTTTATNTACVTKEGHVQGAQVEYIREGGSVKMPGGSRVGCLVDQGFFGYCGQT